MLPATDFSFLALRVGSRHVRRVRVGHVPRTSCIQACTQTDSFVFNMSKDVFQTVFKCTAATCLVIMISHTAAASAALNEL